MSWEEHRNHLSSGHACKCIQSCVNTHIHTCMHLLIIEKDSFHGLTGFIQFLVPSVKVGTHLNYKWWRLCYFPGKILKISPSDAFCGLNLNICNLFI